MAKRTTRIYTLSLHDALPILWGTLATPMLTVALSGPAWVSNGVLWTRPRIFSANVIASSSSDRKSTRLNSSHSQISYAVFCLKKKIHLSLLPRRLHTGLATHT